VHVLRGPIGTAFPDESSHLHEGANTLLDEERVPRRACEERLLQWGQDRFAADQCVEQVVRALGVERVESDLAVVRLAIPAVREFWPVVYEQQDGHGRGAPDQNIKGGLALELVR